MGKPAGKLAMITNRFFRYALLPGLAMLGSFPAAAVDVVITDVDHPSGTACQNMSALSITQSEVNISFPGECVGSGSLPGQSVAVNQTISVTGGSSATKDLSTGATVTLPFEASAVSLGTSSTTLTTPPLATSKGTVSISSGSTITYNANTAATATTDVFYYRLNDSTTANTNAARVDVSIAAGGGTGSCTTTSTLICKGTIAPFVTGFKTPLDGAGDSTTHNEWRLPPGVTHAYQFAFTPTGTTRWRLVLDQYAGNKTIWISTAAGQAWTAGNQGCSIDGDTITLRSDTNADLALYCELHTGTNYFVNVRTNLSTEDKYYMYSNGPL